MKLIDRRTDDGSRRFARLPKGATWEALRDHVAKLAGSEIEDLVVPRIEEPWLRFTYQGHRFLVRNHDGGFHFFVSDPLCSDMHLYRVASHCERLLGSE